MSELQFRIIIIMQITMPIVFILFFKFFESYFSKKGENLATIEDINRITSKIENIKYEFAKLLEVAKTEIYLISQRLTMYNSQKDDLIFQVFEEANQLFNELSTPSLDVIGYNKFNQAEWDSYLKLINNSINSIVTKRSKLVVFFNKDEEVLKCIDSLLKPLLKATTELNNLSAEISNKNSILITDSVYVEIEGEFKVRDFERMKEYIIQISDDLKEYIEFVHSLQSGFELSKSVFLTEVQNYYEKLRNQFNVR